MLNRRISNRRISKESLRLGRGFDFQAEVLFFGGLEATATADDNPMWHQMAVGTIIARFVARTSCPPGGGLFGGVKSEG